jgi:hypothetical protein
MMHIKRKKTALMQKNKPDRKAKTKSVENFQKSRETHLAVRAKALATVSLKLQSPSA